MQRAFNGILYNRANNGFAGSVKKVVADNYYRVFQAVDSQQITLFGFHSLPHLAAYWFLPGHFLGKIQLSAINGSSFFQTAVAKLWREDDLSIADFGIQRITKGNSGIPQEFFRQAYT